MHWVTEKVTITLWVLEGKKWRRGSIGLCFNGVCVCTSVRLSVCVCGVCTCMYRCTCPDTYVRKPGVSIKCLPLLLPTFLFTRTWSWRLQFKPAASKPSEAIHPFHTLNTKFTDTTLLCLAFTWVPIKLYLLGQEVGWLWLKIQSWQTSALQPKSVSLVPGKEEIPGFQIQARGLTTVAVNSLKGKAPNSLNKQIINEFWK